MRGRLQCLNWRSINGHHARHPEVLGEPVLKPNCHVHVENNMVKAIAANKPRRRFSPSQENEENSSVSSGIFIRFLAYRESGRIWALKTPTAGYLISTMRAKSQAGWSGCGPDFIPTQLQECAGASLRDYYFVFSLSSPDPIVPKARATIFTDGYISSISTLPPAFKTPQRPSVPLDA